MLMSEALELYLTRPNLSQNTRRSYQLQLGGLLRVVGDMPIEEIRHVELMRYIASRQSEGQSPRSLNLITSCLKAFFSWMIENDYLERNPALRLASLKIEALRDEERAISMADWQILKAYVRNNSARDYALLAFMLDSACRVSAAASLRLQNLELPKLRAVVYEPKIRSKVEVSFGKECANALSAWLEQRPETEHDFVFTALLRPYAAIKADGIRAMMKRACAEAGIEERTPHALRHAVLQHFARQPDVTLLDVQTKANHKSARTTLNNYYPQRSERVFELSRRYSLVDESPKPDSPQLRILPKRSS